MEGTDGIDGERKGLNDMARFNLAPSRLARYYFFECDRFLRYDATSRDRRAEEGIPAREFDTSPVRRAILAGGEAWEQHVLMTYLPDALSGAPSTDDASDVTKRTLPYVDGVAVDV